MIAAYNSYSKEELIQEVITLKSELTQLKRLVFGSRSERFVPIQPVNQETLALDIEKLPEQPTVKERVTYERNKSGNGKTAHTGRAPIPAHIERRTEVIEPEGDLSDYQKIGEEVTETLEYEAPKFFVRKIVRPKYARKDRQKVVIAQLPSLPIEKGMAGASLLSWIIIEKFVYHMPLHRLIQKFAREGIRIPAPTISDWVRQSCQLLDLLFESLRGEVLSTTYLQADETPIPVLDKDKQGSTHQGYYWVYHSPEKKLVLFDYRPGRGRQGPSEILKEYTGYLQTDGYVAYEGLDKKRITLLHCMAHARRYFEQALDNDSQRAQYALNKFQQLYRIEQICRENNYSPAQRLELRQEQALPVLAEMKVWMKENCLQVLPKSQIGKAIAYSMQRWDKLSLYAGDGRLEMDNNLIENQIRPVALGRKNYLFAGSHEAAQRHAMIYSFIGTCKLRGIDPEKWLQDVLATIQDQKVHRLREFFA